MRHRRPRGLWLPLTTLLLHEIGPTKKPCPIVAQVLVRVGQCSSCFPADWWHGLVVLPGMVPSMPCVRCWQASGWPMLSFMAIGKCAWRSQLALRASRPGSRVIGWRSHFSTSVPRIFGAVVSGFHFVRVVLTPPRMRCDSGLKSRMHVANAASRCSLASRLPLVACAPRGELEFALHGQARMPCFGVFNGGPIQHHFVLLFWGKLGSWGMGQFPIRFA